jgi:outer membrane protein assembly factor BamB
VSASFTQVSSEKLIVNVPSDATTGRVSVKVAASTATSAKVLRLTQTLTSFAPTSGHVGVAVTVTGTGFAYPCSVAFGTVMATCTVASATMITTTVPAGAVSSEISVTMGSTKVTTTSNFVVTLGIALSSATGPPGSTISVYGSGFDASEVVDLYVGSTDEALAVTNPKGDFSLAGLTIPTTAQPGEAWITANGRHSSLGAQTSFDVNTNWTQFGFGASGQRFNPYENTVGRTAAPSLGLLWSYATDNDVVSSPAIVNGVVYVGSNDGNVYAINASTGHELWQTGTFGEVQSSPAVANGIVYVGSDDGNLYALRSGTGAPLFTFGTNGTFATGGPVTQPPTISNGVIYVPSSSSSATRIDALNASTGTLLWSYSIPTPSGYEATASGLVVTNGAIYFNYTQTSFDPGLIQGSLYALKAVSGALIYEEQQATNTSGSCSLQSVANPTVANGLIFIQAEIGICAVDASTGALRWEYDPMFGGYGGGSSPVVADNVVYADYFFNLVALNATSGAHLWTYTNGAPVGGIIDSSPAIANGVIYVGSSDGGIYALDSSSGAVLWSDATGGAVAASPAIANGQVYVGSDDGSLYAFGINGGVDSSSRPNQNDLRPNFKLRVEGVIH